MASSRLAVAVACQLGVLGAFAAAIYASQHGLYGNLLLASLVGIGIGSAAIQKAAAPCEPSLDRVASSAEGDNALLRALLDQAPTPLLAVEEEGRIRVLNRAARRLFATDSLVLPPPLELLSSEASRFRRAGRGYRIDRATAQGLGPPHKILALTDIEAEERTAEARATRDLLQVLSHEVMNALAPISSLADSARVALDDKSPDIGSLRDVIATLARRADGLQRFTEAYRAMARLPEPAKEWTNLQPLFDDLSRLFQSRWSRRVAFLLDPPPEGPVMVDRDQLTQALWALLQNGAEAAVDNGNATVQLGATIRGELLTVYVIDSGAGGDVTQQDDVFRAFFTTKSGGTGVGLSLVQQIARAHGGEVVLVQSSPTLFELRIPGNGVYVQDLGSSKELPMEL